ncbi:MAG: alpha/beta hydrolase [Gaiellales bacterium]
MPLDPQARAYLDALSAGGSFPVVDLTPERARAMINSGYSDLFGPVDEVGSVVDVTLPGRGGPIPARVYSPPDAGSDLGASMYFHGGGWVIGSLDSHDGVCRALAARAGCIVVAVDYRLAPEHRFPAAVDDAWAATVWVAERGADLGIRSGALALTGDSAGGGLAAVVARRARDHGLALAHQLLIFPVTDCDLDRPSYLENDEIGPSIESLRWFWSHYMGPDGDPRHPDASPLRADDLRGLAPATVITAECDTLRDEGEAYAARLRDARVSVSATRYDGLIHGFFRMGAVIDSAGACLDECARALRTALDCEPPPRETARLAGT